MMTLSFWFLCILSIQGITKVVYAIESSHTHSIQTVMISNGKNKRGKSDEPSRGAFRFDNRLPKSNENEKNKTCRESSSEIEKTYGLKTILKHRQTVFSSTLLPCIISSSVCSSSVSVSKVGSSDLSERVCAAGMQSCSQSQFRTPVSRGNSADAPENIRQGQRLENRKTEIVMPIEKVFSATLNISLVCQLSELSAECHFGCTFCVVMSSPVLERERWDEKGEGGKENMG